MKKRTKAYVPEEEIPTSKLSTAMKYARESGLPIVEIRNRYVVTSAPQTLMKRLEKHGLGTRLYPLKPRKPKKKRSSFF